MSDNGGGEADGKKKRAPLRRFKSPFIIFSASRHGELRKELEQKGQNKQARCAEIAKLLSVEWQNMTTTEKQVWGAKSREDKARYDIDKAAHKAADKAADKKNGKTSTGFRSKRILKDKSAPKRPTSAYLSYSNERRAEMKRQNPTATNGELSRLLSKKWKAAPNEEKSDYLATAARSQEKYKVELAAWKKTKAAELKADRKREREEEGAEEEEEEADEASSINQSSGVGLFPWVTLGGSNGTALSMIIQLPILPVPPSSQATIQPTTDHLQQPGVILQQPGMATMQCGAARLGGGGGGGSSDAAQIAQLWAALQPPGQQPQHQPQQPLLQHGGMVAAAATQPLPEGTTTAAVAAAAAAAGTDSGLAAPQSQLGGGAAAAAGMMRTNVVPQGPVVDPSYLTAQLQQQMLQRRILAVNQLQQQQQQQQQKMNPTNMLGPVADPSYRTALLQQQMLQRQILAMNQLRQQQQQQPQMNPTNLLPSLFPQNQMLSGVAALGAPNAVTGAAGASTSLLSSRPVSATNGAAEPSPLSVANSRGDNNTQQPVGDGGSTEAYLLQGLLSQQQPQQQQQQQDNEDINQHQLVHNGAASVAANPSRLHLPQQQQQNQETIRHATLPLPSGSLNSNGFSNREEDAEDDTGSFFEGWQESESERDEAT